MKTWAIVVLAALLGAGTAQARLGETEAQIEARFGKPLTTTDIYGTPAKVFCFRGFVIGVCFMGGRSAVESFTKIGEETTFSDAEIETFREHESAGKTWTKIVDTDFINEKWKRSDGGVVLVYQKISAKHGLVVMTREGAVQFNSSKDSKEKKALEKF